MGYIELKDSLLNMNNDVKYRLDKLRILLLGQDKNGTTIWNNGNVLRINIDQFEDIFKKMNADEMWKDIKEDHDKRSVYRYRESGIPNRHGHSNALPSYWAYGYQTIEAFMANISKEEWNDYYAKHKANGCCGL